MKTLTFLGVERLLFINENSKNLQLAKRAVKIKNKYMYLPLIGPHVFHPLMNWCWWVYCSRCDIDEEPEDEDEIMAPTYQKTFKKKK